MVISLVAFGCGRTSQPNSIVGQLAPQVTFERLDGTSFALSSWTGAPVVLSFWATWCRPCRHEFPALNELHAQGVRVVAVALDRQGATKVEPFVRTHELAYPIALGDKAMVQRFGGNAIPYTLILDARGVVAAAHRGAVSAHTLKAGLARLDAAR